MSDKIEKIGTVLTFKHDLLETIDHLEIFPVDSNAGIDIDKSKKIPATKLASLGVGFEPIKTFFKNSANKSADGKSGLYQVTVPKGGQLASFKDEQAFLGSVLKGRKVGGGQARLKPTVLPINPVMMFMAVALMDIDSKLSAIQETQQEILDFLIQKERSDLKGDLLFLTEITQNLKYNWDNKQYKSNLHIKVLDIKQTSEKKIDLFRKPITANINRKSVFQSNKQIEKKSIEIQEQFKDYQLAVYLYAYSAFLDVMLLENYQEEYLGAITKKIEKYAYNYRELYTECYSQIESSIRGSFSNKITGGVSQFTSKTSEFVTKNAILQKTKIDKTLLQASEKLENHHSENLSRIMQPLVESQSSYVQPFIDGINEINELYNEPLEIYFDKDHLYIGRTN